MALKINVDGLLNIYKEIKVQADNFSTTYSNLTSTYNGLYGKVKARCSINFDNSVDNTVENLTSCLDFLTRLAQTVEEAMHESVESLTNPEGVKHTQEEYEHAIMKSYVTKHYDEIREVKTASMDSNIKDDNYDYFYDFTYETGSRYAFDPKVVKYYEISSFINDFNNKTGYDFTKDFGLSEQNVYDDFIEMYRQLGNKGVANLYKALIEFCPSDFKSYNINLSDLTETAYENEDTFAFGNNSSFTHKYIMKAFGFLYNIKGHEVAFDMYVPSDATDIMKLLYLFVDVDYIKEINKLPKSLVDETLKNIDRIVISEMIYDAYKENVGGLYDFNVRAIGIPFNSNIFGDYERDYKLEEFIDVLIHEFFHAFDDALVNDGFFSQSSGLWNSMFNKYRNELWQAQIRQSGYKSYDKVESEKGTSISIAEFFAESLRAYFENPEGLKNHCPELYETIKSMLGSVN